MHESLCGWLPIWYKNCSHLLSMHYCYPGCVYPECSYISNLFLKLSNTLSLSLSLTYEHKLMWGQLWYCGLLQVSIQELKFSKRMGPEKQVLPYPFQRSWAWWLEICPPCSLLTHALICHKLCPSCYQSWVHCGFSSANSDWMPANDHAEHIHWQPCWCRCCFSIWFSEISGLVIPFSCTWDHIKHFYFLENQKVLYWYLIGWSVSQWACSWL